MICEFCSHVFSTKYTLLTHQKKAIYCLKIQQIIPSYFKCITCMKKYTTKQRLNIHLLTHNKAKTDIKNFDYKEQVAILTNECQNLRSQLVDYKEQVFNLQNKLQNALMLAVSIPTTNKTTNKVSNYIQNMDVITDEYINEQVSFLTLEHILKGAVGYANYAIEYPFNNRLVCVDFARRKVKYKDKDGNMITDLEMNNLSNKLFNSIRTRNSDLIKQHINDIALRSDMNFETKAPLVTNLLDCNLAVERCADGKSNTLYNDVVKNICSQTVV